MTVNNTKFRLPSNKYFQEADHKDMIMLHFTAGSSVDGAFNSWLHQDIKIGTPYIVDKDGTVYEIFDPKYWAYHLGVTGPKAQNHKHDKRSVPIEIINMGSLKLVGDTLYSWPNNYKQKFCNISETNKFVKANYRGFDYYEAFAEPQKVAVVELVKHISETFSIPVILPPVEKQDKFDLDFFDNWKGVASHQNFRNDKTDIGPAFSWDLLK